MSPGRLPRLLVIGPTPPPYHGVAVATRTFLDSPLRERFELVHLDTSDRRGLTNIGRLDPVNVGLALAHLLRFLRAVAAGRPDVVYVPVAQNRLGFLRDALFLIPGRLAGAKVVAHLHGGYFGDFYRTTDPLTRWVARRALGGAARVVVLGEALRGAVRGLVAEDRVAVVPNGIADPFGGDAPERVGRAGAEKRVVYLGNLTRAKGFLTLLEAAVRILARRSDVRFILAGSFAGPDDEAAAAPFRRGALAARIEFPGVVTGRAKYELLREADVFVFPPHAFEGHPYVILEAMAAGLPIVTTGIGAIPETVEDGVSGWLVPPADAGALEARIAALLDDAGARAQSGAAARRRYLERGTLDRWIDGLGAALSAARMES